LVVVFLQRLSHARQQHIRQMSLAAAGDIRMRIQHQLQPGGAGFYRVADKEQRFGVNRLSAFLQHRHILRRRNALGQFKHLFRLAGALFLSNLISLLSAYRRG